MSKKIFRIAAVLTVNVLAVAALLLAAEGAARLAEGDERPFLFEDREMRIRGTQYVVSHPRRGFALREGYRSEKVNVDSRGFRGSGGDAAEGCTALFLGESTVFGWKVRDGLTIPALAGEELAKSACENATVINAGVPSYTSSQVLLYLRELLERPDIRPDLVMVSVMWNDLWYSGTLNWYPELLVFQQPSPWRAFLVRNSALYRLALLRGSPGEGTRDYFNEAAYVHYRENLFAMAAECRRRGVPLLFVEPPYSRDHLPEEGVGLLRVWFGKAFLDGLVRRYAGAMAEAAGQAGADVVLHGLGPSGEGPSSLFMDFSHPLPEGNRRIASEIVRHIEGRSLLPSPRGGASSSS